MNITPTAISDVILIEPSVYADERGSFMEVWQRRDLLRAGIHADFVQANHSSSQQWVLRGLHYQIEQTQGKLVRVVSGAVFDVVVDLRKSSPTFGQSVAAVLSAANRKMLWVPPGFAHGVLVTSESADVSYYCTDYYAPQHERSLAWNDPALNILWPLPHGTNPILSSNDAAAANWNDAEYFA